MSRENETGSPVHLEIRANDGPSAEPFLIYPAGSSTAIALVSTQAIWITDVILGIEGTDATTYSTFEIHSGTAGAGKTVMGGFLSIAGGITHHFETPFQCVKGETPQLTCSADANDVTCVMTARLVDLG